VSVIELIEQIKALPPEDIETVRQFILNGDSSHSARQQEIRYIDPKTARGVGQKIMSENEELFRRLAQ
jgi:hypothetical protein